MKKKNKILLLCIFFSVLFCMAASVCAEAKGSITLLAAAEKDGNSVLLKNVEFMLYQVGTEQNGTWMLKSDFAGTDVVFDFEDASLQEEDAKKLEQWIQKKGIKGITRKTGQDGKLLFENLDTGIYLVMQPQKIDVESEAYQSEPFLLAVPGTYEGTVLWDITAEPKFKNESIPPIVTKTPPLPEKTEEKRVKKVNTGDATNISAWMIAFFAAVTAAGLGKSRKKHEK